MRYKVDLETGHKTGFFCDQRDNRRDFAQWATGDVLDLCCYTGGFAAAVAVGGRAASVTGVDLDEEALATARENLNLVQQKYIVGSATIIVLIDAQVALLRAAGEFVSAMADIRIAEATVDRVRGKTE